MNEAEIRLLVSEVRRLRRAYRTQRSLLLVSIMAIAALALTLPGLARPVRAQSKTPDGDGVLHVRGLVIEDRGGHERLRLGAPLPDPIIHGVRQKRTDLPIAVLVRFDLVKVSVLAERDRRVAHDVFVAYLPPLTRASPARRERRG